MKIKRNSEKKFKELWYRFSLYPTFEHDIKLARETLEIPSCGFKVNKGKVEKDFDRWFNGNVPKQWGWFQGKTDINLTPNQCAELEATRFVMDILANSTDNLLIENQEILIGLCRIYIYFGPVEISGIINEPFACRVIDPTLLIGKKSKFEINRLSKLFKKSMAIIIYPHTSQDDIKYLLKIKWPYIKEKFKEKIGNNTKRIRATLNINKEIYKEVINLNNKDRKKLGLNYRGAGKKISVIANILAKKYKTKVSEDKVRNIIKKYKKSVKGV